MEYWVLYLCSIADSIHTLFTVLGIIGLVLTAVIAIMSICSSQCDRCGCDVCVAKGVRKAGIKVRHVFIPAIIMVVLGVCVPSTKSCYAIFGVGATLHYVNHSEEAQKIPDNAMKAVNRYLESLAPNDSIQ